MTTGQKCGIVCEYLFFIFDLTLLILQCICFDFPDVMPIGTFNNWTTLPGELGAPMRGKMATVGAFVRELAKKGQNQASKDAQPPDLLR
jgi:hypothetical protein